MTVLIYDHEGWRFSGDQKTREPNTEGLRDLFNDLTATGQPVVTVTFQDLESLPVQPGMLLIAHPTDQVSVHHLNISKALDLARRKTAMYILLVSSDSLEFRASDNIPNNIRCCNLNYNEMTDSQVVELRDSLTMGKWPENSPLFSHGSMEDVIALYLLFAGEQKPTYERNPDLFERTYKAIKPLVGELRRARDLTCANLHDALAATFDTAARK